MTAGDPFLRGLELARRAEYELALACLQRSLALTGERSDTLRLMGKVHLRLGELAQARSCWLRALALDPDDSRSAECLAVLAGFRKTRRAAAALGAALAVALALAGAWYEWGGPRAARPTAKLERAAPSPRAPVAEEERAPARAAEQPAPAAEPLSEEAYARLYREALDLARRGEIAEARARFAPLAAEEHAGRRLAANVHFWLGRCLYESKETEAALREFALVVERYPASAKRGDALLDMGRCWLRLGRRDRAEESFKELLAGDYEPALQELARKFIQP